MDLKKKTDQIPDEFHIRVDFIIDLTLVKEVLAQVCFDWQSINTRRTILCAVINQVAVWLWIEIDYCDGLFSLRFKYGHQLSAPLQVSIMRHNLFLVPLFFISQTNTQAQGWIIRFWHLFPIRKRYRPSPAIGPAIWDVARNIQEPICPPLSRQIWLREF